MNTSNCNCNSKGSSSAALLERPRYYPRQLVTADVLTLGQDYQRGLLHMHNRLLHGWGVVCGLMVSAVPAANGQDYQPWKVSVAPGYALARSGDGILVQCQTVIDLHDAPNCSDPCANPAVDPWCADLVVDRPPGIYYIAIRYTETMVRPERVQPTGCGCSDQTCEDSRVRDGYEIGALCDCPQGDDTPPPQDFAALLKCDNMGCPQCGNGAWLGLARVEVDTDGSIKSIDNCACRRMVVSFGNFWWKCNCEVINLEPAAPNTVLERGKSADITIKAPGIDRNAIVTVPRGVKVTATKIKGDKLTLTVVADKNAAAGPRTILVRNPSGNIGTLSGALEVSAPPAGGNGRSKRIVNPRP